jgi:predicted amidophosphoribosyltransferase
MLDLLKKIISLPSPECVDTAVAMDWYKIAADNVDPYQWLNTEDGELVSSGKYKHKYNAELQRTAGRVLADHLCAVIDQHPILRSSAVVLNVPGHDATVVSFGSRLAATVAQRRGLPLVRVRAESKFRPPAKSLATSAKAQMVKDQFTVQGDIRGQPVLVVDDVFRSGWSLGAVATAARRSQASSVYGICCVRTMRR